MTSSAASEKSIDLIEDTRQRIRKLEIKLEQSEATGQLKRVEQLQESLNLLQKKENLLQEEKNLRQRILLGAGCLQFVL